MNEEDEEGNYMRDARITSWYRLEYCAIFRVGVPTRSSPVKEPSWKLSYEARVVSSGIFKFTIRLSLPDQRGTGHFQVLKGPWESFLSIHYCRCKKGDKVVEEHERHGLEEECVFGGHGIGRLERVSSPSTGALTCFSLLLRIIFLDSVA